MFFIAIAFLWVIVALMFTVNSSVPATAKFALWMATITIVTFAMQAKFC